MVRTMDDGNSITKDAIYEAAASIGQSFRLFAERHGSGAAVEGPMQRVISILEQLEVLATRNEAQDSALTQLRLAVQNLQVEKARHVAEERADQQERERNEETWEQESQQLLKTLAKLREDNNGLKRQIEASSQSRPVAASHPEEDQTHALALLNQTAAEQRARIRELQRDNKEKAAALEFAKQKVKCLEEDNTVLRLVDASSAAHVLRLDEQKRQLAQALAEQEPVALAAAALPAAPADAPDCSREAVATDATESSAASRAMAERNAAMLSEAGINSAVSASFPILPAANRAAAFEHEPRFTEKELRALYAERSDFRTRLADVQAELAHLKALQKCQSVLAEAASGLALSADGCDVDDVDAPVQGPINREPWEKLHPPRRKQRESKIVSFFKLLGSAPARSSSPRNLERSTDDLV